MVRVEKMRHRGFFFFSRPTGLLQRSDDILWPTRSHCASRTAPDSVRRGGTSWRVMRESVIHCSLGSFYTSTNAPNVRTLYGHIEIPLAKHPSRGHVAQSDFDITVQRSDVRGVRAGV